LCTGDIRPNAEMDEYVVMPNHFHGIVILNAGNICRGMARHAPTRRQFAKPIANSLSTIVGAFKSAATKSINMSRNTPGMPVWQKNYFERVIRNEKELFRIREYIRLNPVQWDIDEENPANIKKDNK
jgi:putative transposase